MFKRAASLKRFQSFTSVLIRSRGHRESRNDAGSQSPKKNSVEFGPETWFWGRLDPLSYPH